MRFGPSFKVQFACASLMFLLVLIAPSLFAVESKYSLETTTTVKQAKVVDDPVFSGSLTYEYGQSAYDTKDGSFQRYNSYLANVSARLGGRWLLSAETSFDQNLEDSEVTKGNGVSDTAIILRQNRIALTDWLMGAVSLTGTLPTSTFSQTYENLQGSAGADYLFSINPRKLIRGLNISVGLGATRNFHSFTTDTGGNILNPYGVRESFIASYDIKKFSFSTTLVHRSAWDYENEISEDYEHTEEVAYQILRPLSVALGITNRAPWIAPNGQDSNLRLVDEATSIFYGSLGWRF